MGVYDNFRAYPAHRPTLSPLPHWPLATWTSPSSFVAQSFMVSYVKKAGFEVGGTRRQKEHKARMALAHADSQQEAIRAQQQISQAEAMKKTASSFIKNQQIDGEIASEKQALMAERATDSEMRAVNKLKSYQSADQSVEDTSIVPETENMKQFFKTSNIYKKYQQEKVDEGQEDHMNQETEESVAELKTKFINLQSKYSALQDKVEQQNDLAMKLQSQIDTHNQYAKK